MCQICARKEIYPYKLREHYVTHFKDDLDKKFGHFVEDNKCLLCSPPVPKANRTAVLRHMGTWHNKVGEFFIY